MPLLNLEDRVYSTVRTECEITFDEGVPHDLYIEEIERVRTQMERQIPLLVQKRVLERRLAVIDQMLESAA
jgi:hypothetical protein